MKALRQACRKIPTQVKLATGKFFEAGVDYSVPE